MKNNVTIKELPSLDLLENELARERYKNRYKKTLRGTLYILIVVSAAAVLLAMLVFPVFKIYGTSMSPTVNEGEVVVSLKGSNFKYGDVIVLSYNNKILVKRVIAGPGEMVNIDSAGNVYVDGLLLDEPYLREKAYGDCNISLPYQVPDGRYFVMGDNRAASKDSRSTAVGCIADDQIVGKAIFCIWPFENFGSIKDK